MQPPLPPLQNFPTKKRTSEEEKNHYYTTKNKTILNYGYASTSAASNRRPSSLYKMPK